MTTPSTADPRAAARPQVPVQRPAPARLPEERRGRTEVSDRVAAKIACRVARELPEVLDVGERGGLPWTRSPGAEVRDDHVTIALDVVVAYPAPLRSTTGRIRRHVAARVGELTGLRVRRVDVAVTDLRVTP
ncbi:Asp23/Gls24 family envelope stress response protein [Nonomuraea sp. NPDC005983]|uniref:Asp23/Gls24 family envelope stress response protein n=1 Tax=Nonomuraea sp. NPDC005983 TaxID=3155595 RepID=UPI0033BAB283